MILPVFLPCVELIFVRFFAGIVVYVNEKTLIGNKRIDESRNT